VDGIGEALISVFAIHETHDLVPRLKEALY
jgi:hypothetical protein